MSSDIRRYVRSCDSCQRNKEDQYKPFGLLQPLSIPERKQSNIMMDFITHLPKTSDGYDALTVFADRLTKMGCLVPSKTTDKAPDIAK